MAVTDKSNRSVPLALGCMEISFCFNFCFLCLFPAYKKEMQKSRSCYIVQSFHIFSYAAGSGVAKAGSD